MVSIGIDLGGTGIKVGVVNGRGEILARASGPTLPARGEDVVTRDMTRLSLEALKKSGYGLDDVSSIGIGVPGIEDISRGIVPFLTNLGWHETPLRQLIRRDIDKPVFIANDATAAALAESVAGILAGAKNSALVTLGTGVGGGVIMDGKLLIGSHGIATEIGHMNIKFDGEMCTCGKRGCWERYASASALIREGRKLALQYPDSQIAKNAQNDPLKITAKTVIDAARAGDPPAVKLFDDYVFWVCVGLANLINVYDPEIIALGGGVSAAGDFLLKPIRERLPEQIFYKTMPYARIELATLGNDAGIIGAAMLGA